MSRLLQIGMAVLIGALIAFGALAATTATVPSPAHAKAKSPAHPASHRSATSSTKSKVAAQPVAKSELAMPVPMPVGSAGLRAYMDPETGSMTTIQPVGLEQVAIDPNNDSDVGLQQVQLPAGRGVMIDLQGRYQEYMVVRLNASGHRVFSCEKNPAILKAMMSTPAVSPYAER